MRPTLVLLPSVLLGPAVWQPVAEHLAAGGWAVRVGEVPLGAALPETVLAAYLGCVPEDERTVLVPHSNAGLYVPHLLARRDVVATVFVDAALPPERGRVPLAPPAHLAHLKSLADAEGMLPPWTRWWPEADVEELFPGPRARRAVEAEQRALPLRYFAGSLPPVPGRWVQAPAAYLGFGGTYDAEQATARARGWPVRTVAGRHLHLLVDPPAVAAALVEALADLGWAAPRGR